MRDALSSWLSERSGTTVEVEALERIAVGHSRAMYRVATTTGDRLVLRLEQGGVFGTSGADEAALMRVLHAAGLPVARVRWEERSGALLGRPFFVMDEVPADSHGRGLPPGARRSFVRALARVHEEGPAALDGALARPASTADATRGQVDRWHGVYRSATDRPVPLLEEAAAWLRRGAPDGGRVGLVHGDAGPDNVLYRGTEIVALTDWEFGHLGDPAEDWVFCATMRGTSTLPVDAWRALFAEEAGWSCDDATWRYWEAFNLFKGSCANLTALRLFERGDNRSPDMAIIGTSLHQVFLRRLVDLVG